jgi:hypothetical protein
MSELKLLTRPAAQSKLKKSLGINIMTFGHHLAAANTSGHEVCHGSLYKGAELPCRAICLNTAGRASMVDSSGVNRILDARVRKTKLLFQDRDAYLDLLRKDIKLGIKKAKKEGMKPSFRLNTTSDLPFVDWGLAKEFPEAMFYDYTKVLSRMRNFIAGKYNDNVYFTWSWRGADNDEEILKEVISAKKNVAIPFALKKNQALPKKFLDIDIIDGDLHDYRPSDDPGKIVGLRLKAAPSTKDRAHRESIGADFIILPSDHRLTW